jgi:hypothetical protein
MNLTRYRIPRLLISFSAIGLLLFLISPAIFAQDINPPSPFDDLPFKIWLEGKNTTQIPWSVIVKSHRLSGYQRLDATISVFAFLDKKDISGGEGQLLTVVRITDAQGREYEARRSSNLKRPTDGQSSELGLTFRAYLLPGDYKVDTAIYSVASKTHSASHQTLAINAIPNDPLPGAWTNLPVVEFYPMVRPPFGLVDTRLQLPLQTNRNVRVDVLANVTPTHAYKPSTFIYRRSVGALFQEFDILSQISVKNGTLNIAALDLDDQKIQFERNDVDTINPRTIWRALMSHDSNVASADSISHQTKEAGFFVSQVKQRLSAPIANGADATRVIIVLSNQMAFPKGEDLSPISVEEDCNCRVFYIRNHVLLDPDFMQVMMKMPSGGPTGPSAGPEGSPPPGSSPQTPPHLPPINDRSTNIIDIDRLEKTLAPLHPHIFDVNSPEDFRKAIATILSEIAGS